MCQRLLGGAALLTALLNAVQASPLSLVENGASTYRILIARNAQEPEQFAASELCNYLFKISGANLPIVCRGDDGTLVRLGSYTMVEATGFHDAGGTGAGTIVVGTAAPAAIRDGLAKQPEDAFITRTQGRDLILAGASPRATLYAVYAFLEGLGVGFPRPGHSDITGAVDNPGPQEETVPRLASISVPEVNRLEKPSFTYRAIVLFYLEKEKALREIDWMAKNRLNWAHLAINAAAEEWDKQEVRRTLMPELRKRGIHVQAQGHSFFFYVPLEKYATTHPEYFATDEKGNRITDLGKPENAGRGALCVSNPDVQRLMVEGMDRFLQENPEIEIIDLWTNDTGWWCLCPKCKEMQGLPADAPGYMGTTRGYMRFVNHVAAELAKKHPKIVVNYLAYPMNMVADPETLPAPNVIVGYAPLGRVLHTVSDDYYTPLYEPGPENNKFHPQFVGWAKQTKNLYLYDYFALRPEAFPIVDTMRKDFAYYKKLGVDKVSTEKVLWTGFNMWAFARLAWDETVPTRKLIDDYCRIAFRVAAEPMKKYFTLMESSKWEWPKHRPRFRELLAEAERLAAGQSARDRDATVLMRLAALRKQMEAEPGKNWEHTKPPPPLD